MNSVFDCKIISLDKNRDTIGAITVLEGSITIPFSIKRVYYMYGVPKGLSRGGHAHKEGHQLIVAISGSFNILLDDGKDKKTVILDQYNKGLLLGPGIWRDLYNFFPGTVCLVFASLTYSENVTIVKYEEFKKFKGID